LHRVTPEEVVEVGDGADHYYPGPLWVPKPNNQLRRYQEAN